MNHYSILCGYLPNTRSCRVHHVQNIKLVSTDDWMRADIYYKEKVIYTIGTIPEKVFYISLENSNNNINLVVNGKVILCEPTLFYVSISIQTVNKLDELNINNIIKIIDDMIQDY